MSANKRRNKKYSPPAKSTSAPDAAPRTAGTGEAPEVEDAARKGLIYLAVVAVAVVVVMAVMMQRHHAVESKALAAAAEYETLDAAFFDENPMMAAFGVPPEVLTARATQLEKTIADHPGSAAAAEAEYYLARTAYEQEDFEAAATKFAAFAETHATDLPAMAGWAKLGQANALAAQAKYAEALPIYKALATVDLANPGSAIVAPVAQLFGATCALELGNTDDAKAMLDTLLASSAPEAISRDAQLIRSRIDLVAAIPATPEAAPVQPAPSDDEPESSEDM